MGDIFISHEFKHTQGAPNVTLQIPEEVIQTIKDFFRDVKREPKQPCFPLPQNRSKYELCLFQFIGETENGTFIRWSPETISCEKCETKDGLTYGYRLLAKIKGEVILQAFICDDNLAELVEYFETTFLDGTFFAIDNSEAIASSQGEWEEVLDGWDDLVEEKRKTRSSGRSRLSTII
jgi:hypothetical protein